MEGYYTVKEVVEKYIQSCQAKVQMPLKSLVFSLNLKRLSFAGWMTFVIWRKAFCPSTPRLLNSCLTLSPPTAANRMLNFFSADIKYLYKSQQTNISLIKSVSILRL